MVNSAVKELVAYYAEVGNTPEINIECMIAILNDIKNNVAEPQGSMLDVIALAIVTEGDY